MARPGDATIALLAAVAGLMVCALAWFVPFLTQQREVVVSTPGLTGLFERTEVPLRPGRPACVVGVRLTPDARVARVRVKAGPRAARVRVTASAPGYASASTAVAGPGERLVAAPLEPIARDAVGRVCVAAPAGARGLAIIGTREARSQVAATTELGGRAAEGLDLELALLSGERRSYLERAGEVLDNVSALTGRLVPAWLLWVLALLVALGIPAAALAALVQEAARTRNSLDRHGPDR